MTGAGKYIRPGPDPAALGSWRVFSADELAHSRPASHVAAILSHKATTHAILVDPYGQIEAVVHCCLRRDCGVPDCHDHHIGEQRHSSAGAAVEAADVAACGRLPDDEYDEIFGPGAAAEAAHWGQR